MTASYEPLFLKYRPQELADVLGQSSVKDTLINAIENNKIVHAYLLTGPRGSGKTSTARIIAKSLNCTAAQDGKSPSTKPCGQCESCISISNSSSIDVTEIDAASHGHVEDARKLIEKVNLASVSGKYRVYIIDEVHMLTNSAFNALLKVIEEPPSNVIFVLATTEVDKVPKTIASRCQQLKFKPINQQDCLERLDFVSQSENININGEALKLIAAHSDGAMRDALGLLDQISVFSNETTSISEDRVLELLGAIPSDQLTQLCKQILIKDLPGLLSSLDNLLGHGKDPIHICQELSNFILSVLEQLSFQDSKEKYQSTIDTIKEHNIENYELVQILDSLSELEIKLKQSIHNKNLLKAWLIKISHRADLLVVKELKERIEKLEQGISTRPSASPSTVAKPQAQARSKPSPQPSPVPNSNPSPVNSSPKATESPKPESSNASSGSEASGESFLTYLSPGSKGMYVSSQAKLAQVSDGMAIINMPDKFKFLKSKLEARKEEIINAIAQDTGKDVGNLSIEIVSGEMPSPKPASDTPAPTQSSPSNEACVNRPEPEAPAESANFQSNINASKLDEVTDAAVSIFGGKEL